LQKLAGRIVNRCSKGCKWLKDNKNYLFYFSEGRTQWIIYMTNLRV
jgi:hypothetical protein